MSQVFYKNDQILIQSNSTDDSKSYSNMQIFARFLEDKNRANSEWFLTQIETSTSNINLIVF